MAWIGACFRSAMALEFQAMVKAGLSSVRALKAGTSVAAELLGRRDLGVLALGKLADIVAMPGDPIDDYRRYRQGGFRDEGRNRISCPDSLPI